MVKHKPSFFLPNGCELPLEPHSRYLCGWSISTHWITREDREQRKGPEKAETAGRTAFVKENKESACRPLHHGICHPLELEWGGNCSLHLPRSNLTHLGDTVYPSYYVAFGGSNHFASACSIAIWYLVINLLDCQEKLRIWVLYHSLNSL